MTDFSSMAAKAKAEQEARAAKNAEKGAQEQRQRDEFVDKAIAALETTVLPILERARADFAKHSVEARIAKHYDVRNYAKRSPSLRFSCFSPKRASDGYQMETPAAFFHCDGSRVAIGRGKESFDREPTLSMGDTPLADVEKKIAEALEKVITGYFEMIELHKHVLKS